MVSKEKSKWGYSYAVLLIAIASFFLFKQWLPDKIFPEAPTVDKEHQAVDEWMQDALEEETDTLSTAIDSTEVEEKEEEVKTDSIAEKTRELEVDKPIYGEQNPDSLETEFFLAHFYNQLFDLLQNPEDKVRIAYFGDSMTDGDLIVQDIRQKFQDLFGGRGVGFVPIASESARSRASIVQRFSKNWQSYTFMKKYDTLYPYGVSGQVYYTDSTGRGSLTYRSGVNRKNQKMPNPVLYYGKSKNDSAVVKMITATDTNTFELSPKQFVNRQQLSSQVLANFEVAIEKADSIPFYGINFDIQSGVQVDNFSSRGNSGLPLTALNMQLTQAFQNELNYDLIVLHFGTNVLNSDSFKYQWYRMRMERVVDYVRKLFPKASVLVISVADKATKYDTEMKTDSAINYLLNQQKLLAQNKKTGFINLFALMGGEGSMIKWAEAEQPQANKDYTHFNSYGAKKVAHLIADKILEGFDEYKARREALERELEEKRIQDSIHRAQDSIYQAQDSMRQAEKDSLQLKDSLHLEEQEIKNDSVDDKDAEE